jgi:signal transduction histidine kinase
MTGGDSITAWSDPAMAGEPRLPRTGGQDMPAGVPSRRTAILNLIGIFWAVIFLVLSARSAVTQNLPFQMLGPRRLITAAFGAILCLAIVALLEQLRDRNFSFRILVGTSGAFVMAIALTSFNMVMNRIIAPLPGATYPHFGESVQWVLLWFGYCLAWVSAHLALTYHWETREQQQRAAVAASLAHEARIAALRYQINPHFLFNSLNSISSLVLEKENDVAEAMLLKLSTFIRATFGTSPAETIALRQEIMLQDLYLDIEMRRFPDRLNVVVDVPDDAARVPVPSLILQPLVENSVRYGVGCSEAMTTIRISARQRAGVLTIVVEDDGCPESPAQPGSGLGLANVRDRLNAHYGVAGRLVSGPRAEGGFRSEIILPLAKTR